MSLKRNGSGANDPTAYEALWPIDRYNNEVEKHVHKTIAITKTLLNMLGFELIGRIEIRHKENGREFK